MVCVKTPVALAIILLHCSLQPTQANFISFVKGLFHLDDTTPNPMPNCAPDFMLTNEQLLQAVNFAKSAYERVKGQENVILNSPIHVSNNSSSYAQLLDSLPNNQTMESDRLAQIVLRASRYLLNNDCIRVGIDEETCARIMSIYRLPPGDLLDECETIHRPDVKGSNTYRRLLPAKYTDGLYKMDEQLPQPKNVSDEFFEQTRPDPSEIRDEIATFEGLLDPERNIALVQWSQFIEHDLVKTVFQTMSNGHPIECCSEEATCPPPRWRHPACAPLIVDVDTQDYNRLPSCLNYVRSALGVEKDCKFGPAEQINQGTNRLDLSQLYGITDDITDSLRTFSDGELMSSHGPSSSTLPEVDDTSKVQLCMHNTTIDTVCYRSGDSRVNANPYITTLYTIFLRSHNRIAKELKKAHDNSWNDEQLFQSARRINTAIYQKIVYQNWTNVVLGNTAAAKINTDNAPTEHDIAVSNEFATAGIRFYYSMMPGDLKTTKDVNYFIRQNDIIIRPMTEESIVKLKDEYYKPRDLSEDDELDNIVEAILKQKAMAMDGGYVADVVKNFYRFRNDEQKHVGTDVFALDILRGRDHGLNSYTKYLELCTDDHSIANWSDLRRYINAEDLERFQKIYSSIDDIDLIVGAIAEQPKSGATVGPTLACIIGEQMLNTKRNDELFYDKITDPTEKQIIDSYTGAKLICDTTRLTNVPQNIFHVPSEKNPLVYCAN